MSLEHLIPWQHAWDFVAWLKNICVTVVIKGFAMYSSLRHKICVVLACLIFLEIITFGVIFCAVVHTSVKEDILPF